ncbi:restriction endonuclease [Streptomyces sp. NPDC051219]|uniref:restriction endonuclease n=1 Tax=Streptomyces sp. NPDC051219 TaxID=3155283 RepID=UPI003442453D
MTRRPAFSLRQTAVGFGLIAILVCGAGLTAKVALRSAEKYPVASVVLAACLLGLMPVVGRMRRRRAAGMTSDAVVDVTHHVLDSRDPAETAVAADTADWADSHDTPDCVDYAAMDAFTFEQAIAELCVRDGCEDVQVVGGAGDLGADVMATAPDGRRIVIQCKCYGPANKVGSQDLQRFGGTCFAVHGAHVAAVVTTSEYTEPAADYAAQCGILCIDQQALDAWTDGTGRPPWEWGPTAAPRAELRGEC